LFSFSKYSDYEIIEILLRIDTTKVFTQSTKVFYTIFLCSGHLHGEQNWTFVPHMLIYLFFIHKETNLKIYIWSSKNYSITRKKKCIYYRGTYL